MCGVRKVWRSSLRLTIHRMVSRKINSLFGVAEFRSLKTAQMELSVRLWVTRSRKPKDVAGGTCRELFSYGREWVNTEGWEVVLEDWSTRGMSRQCCLSGEGGRVVGRPRTL